MATTPLDFDRLRNAHQSHGKAVYQACAGEVFPFDALAFAVLERSLSLIKGFELLMANGGYMSAVALLRLQLDNIIRFHGVARSGDPHGVTDRVFRGESLRKIKDRFGKKMTDAYLVEVMTDANPWMKSVYEHASGYIHLSNHHVRHFIARSETGADGLRRFAIGDDDVYVLEDQREKLLQAFHTTTEGVVRLVAAWPQVRISHGTNEQLKQRFKSAL
ncbi:MAG: hypothetical protein ABWY12_15495 [Burkholderiales bacterium]